MEVAAYYGPNLVQGNTAGGVSARERSRITIFTSQTSIRSNGPVGVTVGFGSQVTLSDVEISGHSSAAVDLYGNSQAWLFEANQLENNGSKDDPASAAIRLDGNSQLFLRSGTIAQNIGPAVLALVNSSVDFRNVSFAANTGGIVRCDGTSIVVGDLMPAAVGSLEAAGCTAPRRVVNREVARPRFQRPNSAAQKARHDKYVALSKHHP